MGSAVECWGGERVLEVLLTTEGTYPFHRGGVATWCDILVQRMEGVRYHVLAVVANPFVPRRYIVPPHVQSVTAIPLWGTEEPTEHLDLPFATVYERKLRTDEAAVLREFMPLFQDLLGHLWLPEADGRAVAGTAWALYRFFQDYDYLNAFKSEMVWEAFKAHAAAHPLPGSAGEPTLRDLVQGLGWVYRFFTVLTTPVPRVDVVHASAAAFSALPGLISKLEYGTPLLLTEHGVYLREQYLSVGRSDMTPFSKAFLLGLIGATSRAALWAADQVSPVAAYNRRWERRLGVSERRFKVIYNGVDPAAFPYVPRRSGNALQVVSVARIDPIKDLETLMRAAVIVRRRLPEVTFTVFGSVSVNSYYERLLALRSELGLEGEFQFAGHVDSPSAAYQSGDVVALSSISEGFPYAVVEAMMSGRPVVATDVGGTSEALGETGRLVPPQDPAAMAAALLNLLGDAELRAELSEEARERALSLFTVQRQIDLYRRSYERMARRITERFPIRTEMRLSLERAEALRMIGDGEGALAQLDRALRFEPGEAGSPLILLRMGQLHLEAGRWESALLCSERAEALALWLEGRAA